MSKNICYYPDKRDREIAEQVPSWNSYYVANLRGLYKEKTGKDTEDIKELLDFRKNLQLEDARRFTEAITNPIAAHLQLKEAFSAQERTDRVNMIAVMFSDIIDDIQEDHPLVDREDIIRGFKDDDGVFQGGTASIYNMVAQALQEEMEEYSDDPEITAKYKKIFKNWGALVTYVNSVLRDTEGVKVGSKLNFATVADAGNYDESSLAESFTMDESTRESWQEVSDSISPFGRISLNVRRAISRLSDYTSDNEEDYDDLGHLRMLSPVKVHQTLMEILRGMQSEEEMIDLLKEAAPKRPYLTALLKQFEEDPILRTQFFVDFGKCFQLYSMQMESRKGDTVTYRNPVLNTVTRSSAFKKYYAALTTKRLNQKNAIFKYRGNRIETDAGKAAELSHYIKEWLGDKEEGSNFFGGTFNANETSLDDRAQFYRNVLQALGVDITEPEAESIARDSKKYSALNKSLQYLPVILGNSDKESDFIKLINKTIGKGSKEGALKEHLGKIFRVVESLDSYKKVLSRVRFQDNTYFSDVQSSYLGRFRDIIDAFARRRDYKGLRKYLEDKYLCDDFFGKKNAYGTYKINNRWLYDLYYSKKNRDFASMFTYKKLLGDDTQKWENFGAKKQAITMINEYFAEGKDYAWYPVFVLGDSGASKWIRAPRYDEKTIIDELYKVYKQELLFQKELKEVKGSLKERGKSLGNFAKMDDNKFGLLPFLNGVKIDDSVDVERAVKNAIKEHLDEAFEEYKWHLNETGVLARTRAGSFVYLGSLSKNNSEEETDAKLKDYFYNSKFATVMQMELMTVNPLFYKNGDSTDLQKRYKEIHASGNRVSVTAVNPFTGGRFSDREYQTTVYFDDVEVNPETTNKEFMEVIKNVYGKDSDIYKTYRDKTSLTDGQGYRTLKAYRAVMGMSGKWNKKCEDAYNEIEDIRREIRENGGKINEEQSERLSGLMVVFQPVKPFMFTHERISLTGENNSSIFLNPVQMKYAEALVIPELMPEGKLRSMIEWAEDNDVDVVAATTAVKTGAYGSVDITKAMDRESVRSAMDKTEIHRLDYKDYVIQNNVPDHVQGSQLFATQCRKLILAGLQSKDSEGKMIYYNNYTGGNKVNLGSGQVDLNAYNLMRFYVSLVSANILDDFNSFTKLIGNPDKLRQTLVQNTINNSRESRDNLRGYGEGGTGRDFLMPLFEPGIEHDTSALLLSLFKKGVNKQKILGGSAVQVSAFGIHGYDEDHNLKFVADPDNKRNILYAECEIPWDLSYTDKQGNKIPLKFDDWCNPDGTLKLGKVTESKDYLSFKDDKGRSHIPLIEERFPGILSIIAYRIPTEEKYSMLNVKAVRFSHKVNGGGIIRVPAQGTSIAGWDFKQYWSL